MNIKLFIVSIFCLFASAVFSQTEKLSIKGRWNIKAGYALYSTYFADSPLIEISGYNDEGLYYRRGHNARIEVNYGVLNWLEIGVYGGFMSYKYYHIVNEIPISDEIIALDLVQRNAFAPIFGINANVHLLPFFVKNTKCHWDFYVPIRYGGTYLTKWVDKYLIFDYGDLDNTWRDVKGSRLKPDKYRHEYGLGLGGAVYIKNIIGFYAEVLGGQFSYWPEIVKNPYAIRVGLTAKF
jgi:hypothetical protein